MKHRLIINEDCSHYIYSLKTFKDSTNKCELETYLDHYIDNGVTDIAFNIYGNLSYTPSKVFDFAADRACKGIVFGKEVDCSDTYVAVLADLYYKQHTDMYQVWFDYCRKKGISAWINLRMNNAESPLFPFEGTGNDWYQHLEDYGIVTHRPKNVPLDYNRNYEIEEIRNNLLRYIDEQLTRYDVDGLELDFLREPFCFPFGHEWDGRRIITEFIGKIKDIITKCETVHGHKIVLSVRCPGNPILSLESGFDTLEWAKRGYIDWIVPAPNWMSTNNNLPITLWKQMMEPYGVKVAGGIEAHIKTHFEHCDVMFPHSLETLFGTAAGIISQNADGLYLFNMMFEVSEKKYSDTGICTGSNKKYEKNLQTLADPEAVLKQKRRHIISYDDTAPVWAATDAVFPKAIPYNGFAWWPKENGQPAVFRIVTGAIPKGRKITLRIGTKDDIPAEKLKVYLNSTVLTYRGTEKCEAPAYTPTVLCYSVPECALQSFAQVAEILPDGFAFTMETIDIVVE